MGSHIPSHESFHETSDEKDPGLTLTGAIGHAASGAEHGTGGGGGGGGEDGGGGVAGAAAVAAAVAAAGALCVGGGIRGVGEVACGAGAREGDAAARVGVVCGT